MASLKAACFSSSDTRYDDGNYLASVLTTHDLDSATIKDIGELIYPVGLQTTS